MYIITKWQESIAKDNTDFGCGTLTSQSHSDQKALSTDWLSLCWKLLCRLLEAGGDANGSHPEMFTNDLTDKYTQWCNSSSMTIMCVIVFEAYSSRSDGGTGFVPSKNTGKSLSLTRT